MSKLAEMEFSAPYRYMADGSVNGRFKGELEFNIHVDATPEHWAVLLEDVAAGHVTIEPYVESPPTPVDPNADIIRQMIALERQITPRRMRDVLLDTEELVDTGDGQGKVHKWLAVQDAKIAALRATLPK